jgi:hypothetical protein
MGRQLWRAGVLGLHGEVAVNWRLSALDWLAWALRESPRLSTLHERGEPSVCCLLCTHLGLDGTGGAGSAGRRRGGGKLARAK